MKTEFAVIGIMLTIAAHGFILWAMAVNTHFEATVRIQKDRNHQVCATGPVQIRQTPRICGIDIEHPVGPIYRRIVVESCTIGNDSGAGNHPHGPGGSNVAAKIGGIRGLH
jgi:hypothetical protein